MLNDQCSNVLQAAAYRFHTVGGSEIALSPMLELDTQPLFNRHPHAPHFSRRFPIMNATLQ